MSDSHRDTGLRNVITLHFPAQDRAVRSALLKVDGALVAAGVMREMCDRAQIALAEACNNIVKHAYPFDSVDTPMIALDIAGDRGGLQIILRDRGGPMPEGRLPGPDLPPLDLDNLLELPEGGFGWPILRRMTCSLSLSRHNGQNILRFRLPVVEMRGQTGQNAL